MPSIGKKFAPLDARRFFVTGVISFSPFWCTCSMLFSVQGLWQLLLWRLGFQQFDMLSSLGNAATAMLLRFTSAARSVRSVALSCSRKISQQCSFPLLKFVSFESATIWNMDIY